MEAKTAISFSFLTCGDNSFTKPGDFKNTSKLYDQSPFSLCPVPAQA